jgi:uncharacterized caspase-like protein
MSNQLHFGVAVGINRYPELHFLTGAKSDAREFAVWLHDPDGGDLPEGNVRTILIPDDRVPDGIPREDASPIRRDVLNAIKSFESNVVDAVSEDPTLWFSTRLYLYMSGHGLAPSPRDAALLMADAGPEHFGENIACSSLLDYFGAAQPYREVVIFMDCCRDRTAGAPLGPVLWTRVKRDNGEVITAFGCATEYGQSAFEASASTESSPDELRGYYTRALLEGLRGAAIDLKSGTIDTNSLQSYVRARLGELTEDRMSPQGSRMAADPGMPIVFRSGLTPKHQPKQTVTLEVTTSFRGAVEIVGAPASIARHNVQRNREQWQIDLPFGLYQVVATDGSQPGFNSEGRFKVIGENKNVIL